MCNSRLNIADVAVAAPVAAAPGAGSGAAAAPAAEAEPEKPKEKTVFTVTLTKIDAAQKAKVIKEVKNVMPTMNLVEAKKFVESVPKTLKENVPKDDIEKMKKAFEAVGASLEVS
ncbi:54S ribosomal protein L12, mitochondrial [Cystobasidiomycetes sp. EMM_F5]